jgi:hypothetical protein|tara:strand:- start:25 stop:300 length:276 start_codon:yes stop_codon:yes gene_type:complete
MTSNDNLDDLTYNLLCNRQKRSNKSFTFNDSNDMKNILEETPNIDETKQILKIIKQKLNNKSIKSNKLDIITDNLLTTCLELIKYNLQNNE